MPLLDTQPGRLQPETQSVHDTKCISAQNGLNGSVTSPIKREIPYSVTLFRNVGCSSTHVICASTASGDTEVLSYHVSLKMRFTSNGNK